MNKQRRAAVARAIALLENAIDIASDAKSDEEFAMSNIPENLQETERYEKMEDAADDLGDAIDDMRSAKHTLKNIV